MARVGLRSRVGGFVSDFIFILMDLPRNFKGRDSMDEFEVSLDSQATSLVCECFLIMLMGSG